MHSVRRAALRAASSSASLSAGVSRQQIASLALKYSKANARPALAMSATRFFSQTTRFRREEEDAYTKEAIRSAEEDVSTTEGSDAPLSVKPTETKRTASPGHVIFVSNMTFDATEVHVREAFSKYGEISSVTIGRDGRGLSRGFAFVGFPTKEAADRAIAEANNSFWHGRRINVALREQKEAPERQRTPSNAEPTKSLYIGNIPYETSDADLNRLFRDLDNVTDVRVAVDRNTGWPRGFAHADFADLESAKVAYETISKTLLGGRNLRVDYSQKKAFEKR